MANGTYATIVFKSGASVDVDVTEIKVARNGITGEITRVTWSSDDDARHRLLTLSVGSIDAIVFHDGPVAEEKEVPSADRRSQP